MVYWYGNEYKKVAAPVAQEQEYNQYGQMAPSNIIFSVL
jgi:hypothetical protein